MCFAAHLVDNVYRGVGFINLSSTARVKLRVVQQDGQERHSTIE